jgi:hypothetical protein
MVRIKIMIQAKSPLLRAATPPAPPSPTPSSDGETASLTSLEGESSKEILADLRQQMQQLEAASHQIRGQMKALYSRARAEDGPRDWLKEPLTPKPGARSWCDRHGLGANPTLEEFTDAVLAAATSLDYETRVATFSHADADILFEGCTSLTVYELLARLPKLVY